VYWKFGDFYNDGALRAAMDDIWRDGFDAAAGEGALEAYLKSEEKDSS